MKKLANSIYHYGRLVNQFHEKEIVNSEQLEDYIEKYEDLQNIQTEITELVRKSEEFNDEDILNFGEQFKDVSTEYLIFLRQLEDFVRDSQDIVVSVTRHFSRQEALMCYHHILSLDLSEFSHYVERLNKYSPFIEEFHEYRYFSYEFFDQYESDCLKFAEYLYEHEMTENAKELVIDIVDILEHVLEDFTMHLLGSSWNPIKNFSEILEREEATGILVSDRIRTMTDRLLRAAL